MENFKKDLFIKTHNVPFQFHDLIEEDIVSLKDFLDARLRNYETSFFELIKNALKHNRTFDDLNSTEGLNNALSALGLLQSKTVIVIWSYPADIDKFDLRYLVKMWEDIWYGESDEAVCLFFPETIKMILITHYNVVYY